MASPLVQRFRNDVAPRLLAKFQNGGVIAQVRTVTTNLDPLQPPTVTTTDTEFNAVAKGVTKQVIETIPNLQAGDLEVICAAVDYMPEVSKQVVINGHNRVIVAVRPIIASGLPAIYKFYVR